MSRPASLLGRLYLYLAILGIDALLVGSIAHVKLLIAPLAPFGFVAAAVFVGLSRPALKRLPVDLPFRVLPFVLHLGCVAAVCLVDLVAAHGYHPWMQLVSVHVAISAVLLTGIVLAALSCLPLQGWMELRHATGSLWAYAGIAGAAAWLLRSPMQSLWDASKTGPGRILQVVTFHSASAVLGFFTPDLISDPNTFTLGTSRFLIIVQEACSGLEGIGLVLAFTVVWLVFFRKESRFPQALLLIPCAVLAVWMLNIVRLAGLILIGDAGAPEVAMVGFHSQAGWMAFTAVALGFSMASRRLSWVRKAPSGSGDTVSSAEVGESPATAAYLVPLLAILAATFVSRAASGYFEWLYPLRFVAAAIALWRFRAEYKNLNWRCGLLAPLIGFLVFAIWVAPEWWSDAPQGAALSSGLASLSPHARFVWIAFRVAAAVLTVPLAEELAFRGFLARRLMSRDFETVPFERLSALSIAASSAVFGVMHGQHWLTGILAGLAYAWLLRRKGRMGDAFAAHATSNLLLAAWVLLRGDWGMW